MTGRISMSAMSTVPTLEPAIAVSGTAAPVPAVLAHSAPRPLGARPTQRLPNSTMIGELKLTALKARLASIGVQAELVGEGVLICGASARQGGSGLDDLGGSVAVRKTARGRVEMEGTVSGVYYKVRKEIYGLHALVAA